MIYETGPLREVIEETIDTAEEKLSLKDLTVLSPQIDPFRLDTPANHRNGEWLAAAAAEIGVLDGDRQIHLRGLHYAIIGQVNKPDGSLYTNTEENWLWLMEKASKAARWLGYIPWEKIRDQRNNPPTIRLFEPKSPWPYLSMGIDVDIPDTIDLDPMVGLADFKGVQPYKLVLVGEKSSLDDVLAPVAESYQADLYLPTGNISDTLVHQIARVAAEDGRPMVVFYFADCDPSGWNMPIEVAHKLRAHKACLYPGLEFRQYRVGLTPDQVREHDLPSTPLKASEKRADKWKEGTGVDQTEIDALASLRPELLRRIAEDAISPFYDPTLDIRVWEAQQSWLTAAQEVVDNNVDQDELDRLRDDAQAKLDVLAEEIEAIKFATRVDIGDFQVPELPEIPGPVVSNDQPVPLADSSWSFAKHARALKDSKAYR